LNELLGKNPGSKVVIRPSSAAGSLIPDLPEARIVKASPQEYAQACGGFFDGVIAGKIEHLDQKSLNLSVSGAKKKPSADAWAWDSRKSIDAPPLEVVTLAAWGHKAHTAHRPNLW
jgi:hypothetical protein